MANNILDIIGFKSYTVPTQFSDKPKTPTGLSPVRCANACQKGDENATGHKKMRQTN